MSKAEVKKIVHDMTSQFSGIKSYFWALERDGVTDAIKERAQICCQSLAGLIKALSDLDHDDTNIKTKIEDLISND